MLDQTTRRLRLAAAIIIMASGSYLIASLWLQPLDQRALLDAVLGTAYLLLGLGLWGRSQFSLWVGIVLPAGAIAVLLLAMAERGAALRWRVAADTMVILCCLLALWRTAGSRGRIETQEQDRHS